MENIEIEYNQTAQFTIINVSYDDLPHKDWINEAYYPPFGGCWTEHPGAEITLIFNGTKVYFYGYHDPYHGYVNIYLDGKFIESINTRTPVRKVNVLIYTSPDLPYGEHNITIQRPYHTDQERAAVGFNCFKYIPTFKGNFSFENKMITAHKNEFLRLNISRETITNESATVFLKTVDGSAKAGLHYKHTQEELVFEKFEVEKEITIQILDFQSTSINNYTFKLVMYNSSEFTTIGIPNTTIDIIDIGNEISFKQDNYNLQPGDQIEVEVLRRGGNTATICGLNLMASKDLVPYIKYTKQITFAPGQVSQKIAVSVDKSIKMAEKTTFILSLSSFDKNSYHGKTNITTINLLMPNQTPKPTQSQSSIATQSSKPTKPPTPIPAVPTPIPAVPTPIPAVPTPIPVVPTPIPVVPTPVPVKPTPAPVKPTKESVNTVNNARVEEKNASGKKNNNNLIIGGAVGGFLFLLLLIAIVLFIIWRSTKHAIESDVDENYDSETNGINSNDDLLNSDDEIDTEALPSQQTTPSEEISQETNSVDTNDSLLQEDDSIEPVSNDSNPEIEEPAFHSLVINDMNQTPIEPPPSQNVEVPPVIKKKKIVKRKKKTVNPDNNIIKQDESVTEMPQEPELSMAQDPELSMSNDPEMIPLHPKRKKVVRKRVRHPSKEIELIDVNE